MRKHPAAEIGAGLTGGCTIIKDYMREQERRGREMFVPLAHPPGHAQADFGEATVIIGGIEQKADFFVMDLPHSDACFVRAYPAATAEAWVDGHVHAFAFFGKAPVSVLYDNDRCLVSKILPDGTRLADLRHIRFSTRQPLMANHLKRLAFIDETLVRTSIATTTGRAPRGRRPVDHAPFGHWRTQSPVGASRHDRLEAPWVILRRRTPCPVPPDPCRPRSAHS